MRKLALLLSLLALGTLGLVACGGGDDDAATAASETETTAASGSDPARKSCGDITHGPRPSKVAVVEGNLPCRVARRVVADFLTSSTPGPIWIETEVPGRFTRGSWACHGPQGNVKCKRKREAPSPSWGKVRGHYYGCCDSTAASEADPARRFCRVPRYRLAVNQGDISCHGARRVILDLANNRLPGSWSCTGDGTPDVVCTKQPGASSRIVITAYFASEAAAVEADPANKNPLAARRTLTEEGVSFSFRVPVGHFTPGDEGWWERHSSLTTDKSARGPISINKSMSGPQDAEAIIFWTSFPDGGYADPCARLLSPPVGSSAADLAAAVSTAPGTELLRGPSNVTLGGRPAKHVALTVRENVGCDPGFFYTWRAGIGGANWLKTGVGDTIRVWIVDVHGTRLFIEAETTKGYGFGLEREVQQIVESIRFE